MGDGTVIGLLKYLYGCTVSYTDFRSDEQTLFWGKLHGYARSQARQPPDARIAAFVADLNVEFGEQEIDEARRSALHRRHGSMAS